MQPGHSINGELAMVWFAIISVVCAFMFGSFIGAVIFAAALHDASRNYHETVALLDETQKRAALNKQAADEWMRYCDELLTQRIPPKP